MIEMVAEAPWYRPDGVPVTLMTTGKVATPELVEAMRPIEATVPRTGPAAFWVVITAWSPVLIRPTTVASTLALMMSLALITVIEPELPELVPPDPPPPLSPPPDPLPDPPPPDPPPPPPPPDPLPAPPPPPAPPAPAPGPPPRPAPAGPAARPAAAGPAARPAASPRSAAPAAHLLAGREPDRDNDAVDRRGERGTAERGVGAVRLGLGRADGRLVGGELGGGCAAGLVLGELGLGSGQTGLRLRGLCLERGGVHGGQGLAHRHPLPDLHVDRGDLPGRAEAERIGRRRLDGAAGGERLPDGGRDGGDHAVCRAGRAGGPGRRPGAP